MYKNNAKILNLLLTICILTAVLFLSIGYAAITPRELNIGVSVSTQAYEGMFISKVDYNSNNGADLANSKIIDYTGTMLHSNIYLNATDATSSITYTVTIFNNSDSLKSFTGISYTDEFYSNQQIAYRLEGLNVNDTIEKGASKTFNLTFYYASSNISNNQLESYLNFNFDYYLEEEVDIDVIIKGNEIYDFKGVSAETPVDLANIANITFAVKNVSNAIVKELKVEVNYITTTGSKQSANIHLYDANGAILNTQNVQFLGKQNNGLQTVTFSNINLENGSKYTVSFDKDSMTNGHVNIIGITITPVF